MNRLDTEAVQQAVDQARARGVDRDPRDLLSWAHDLLGDGLMMTTALQKGGLVLLHMAKDLMPELPVYFLDTGFHFKETLEFFEEVKSEWKVNLVWKKPQLIGPSFTAKYGEKLYERDPDLCCHKNKTESLAELFGPDGQYQGWVTSIRRDQGSTRATAHTLEPLEGGQLKVQPLAFWTKAEVEDYIRKNELPQHPLYAKGYTSIGCEPCTACPGASDPTDERGNRWVGIAKKECGLHTFWKQAKQAESERTAPKTTPGSTRTQAAG